ncbi:MAG: hypothetical protein ACXVCM_17380, partial [Ktedonobacteraceae bacterium]
KNLTFTILTTRGLRITKVRVDRAGTQETSESSKQTRSEQSQSGPLLLSSGKEDEKPNQQKTASKRNTPAV